VIDTVFVAQEASFVFKFKNYSASTTIMKSTTTVTVPAAARQLGFTLKYVYDLIYSGRMRGEKVAGRWHIPVAEVNARLAKRTDQ